MKKIAIIMNNHPLENEIKDMFCTDKYEAEIFSKSNFDDMTNSYYDLLLLGAQSLDELDQLRKKEEIARIPAIVIFEKNMGNSDIVETFKKGVSDIVYVKGTDIKVVFDAVERFFNKEENLEFEFIQEGKWSVINIHSELNIKNSYRLKINIDKLIKQNKRSFIIDISDLNYMESVGLGVLIYIRKKINEISGQVKFVIKSQRIKKLISLVKLEKYLETYDDISDILSISDHEEKIQVAIVDDARFMRALISTVLEEEGFKTITYGEPQVALEELSKNPPDIILVDYEMPVMNGLEFIEEFNPKAKNIPTVMLTTETDVNLAVKAIRLGASDFLNKPFKKEELIHILKKVDKENKLLKENQRLFHELTIREKELEKKNKQLYKLYSELEDELKMASEIQSNLLPQEYPAISGYKFSVKYKPSQDIGGDFYDFIKLNDDEYAIVFADVSGHGIPAALLSTMFKVHLITHVKQGINPSDLLKTLNEEVAVSFPDGKFISLFYMIINNKTETVRYCRASQEPVLLLKKSGEVSELTGSSQVLGLFSEKDFPGILNFEDVQITMEKGDKLFLYTDGINEAQNKDEEFYGTDRLKYVLKENYRADAHEIVTNIFGDLKDFLEGLPILDDLTLMCIEKE